MRGLTSALLRCFGQSSGKFCSNVLTGGTANVEPTTSRSGRGNAVRLCSRKALKYPPVPYTFSEMIHRLSLGWTVYLPLAGGEAGSRGSADCCVAPARQSRWSSTGAYFPRRDVGRFGRSFFASQIGVGRREATGPGTFYYGRGFQFLGVGSRRLLRGRFPGGCFAGGLSSLAAEARRFR